jgi:hypothetical protein
MAPDLEPSTATKEGVLEGDSLTMSVPQGRTTMLSRATDSMQNIKQSYTQV